MPAVKPTHSIGHDKGGIPAPRRLGGWTTEIKTAASDVDLGQADRLIDTVKNSEICRVKLRIRRAARRKAIEARPGFVDQVGTESVCLVQGKDLSQRAAGMTKARDGVTQPVWLSGLCVLNGVISMQTVSFTKIVVDVCRPLIDVDRSARGADEARRAR